MTRPKRIRRLLGSGPGRALPGAARRVLGLNAAPHPRWADALPNAVAPLTGSGAAWVAAALAARLLGARGSSRALRELVPGLAAAAGASYLLKGASRRRRPRAATLRSLLLRKRPAGETSFPSNHAALSFAAAWVFARAWPRWSPAFLGTAAAVAGSRLHLGAHHPGDLVGGAFLGVAVAEAIRRTLPRTPDAIRGRRMDGRTPRGGDLLRRARGLSFTSRSGDG